MKRAVYVGMIFLSVMMIFAAAEMLPQIVIRYNDRETKTKKWRTFMEYKAFSLA